MNSNELLAKLVDPADLYYLNQLEMLSQNKSFHLSMGVHESKKIGGCSEFAEHRSYRHGDDLRCLDWRVLGKNEKHYIKTYQDENEMSANFIIDASGSMGFESSTRSKLLYSKSLCTCLSKIIQKQKDKMGLFIAQNQDRVSFIQGKGISIWQKILKALFLCEPSGENALYAGVEKFIHQSKHQQEVFVFSDGMMELDELKKSLKVLSNKGHQVTFFHILAPEEITFGLDEIAKFQCLEKNGFELELDPVQIKKEYRQSLTAFISSLQTVCLQHKCNYVGLSTSDQIAEVLKFLYHPKSKGNKSKVWMSYSLPDLDK